MNSESFFGMPLKRKVVVLYTALLLFVAGGIYGIFSENYIQINKTVFYWSIIPAFLIGIYYAFGLTSKYDRKEGGKIALVRIGITIMVTMLIFRCTQGYLILYNCNIGKQTKVYIKGEITSLNFPRAKRVFDKNTMDIFLSDKLEKITLEVPTNYYTIGQTFEKEMTLGSLGILYSPNE